MDTKEALLAGETFLGIEFGSTRIKSVLIGENFSPIASGSFEWENRLENGQWTYHLDDVWVGLQESYKKLAAQVKEKYDVTLTTVGAMGVSAMMHGYLVFDTAGGQLVPFRTWRNTITEKAAAELTDLFNYNIPQRWSVAHLYQALLNKEPHISSIDYMTSLAGYVHWKLTGEKALGLNDASGIFPLENSQYNPRMLELFNKSAKALGLTRPLEELLPRILPAGETAGTLTVLGARMLDPSGTLKPGIAFCPPEGDAGTGMVATGSVSPCTGNISAGTSIFAMVVLEKDLSAVYPEIDIVATPAGMPVAMVHCNNCTTDLDNWVKLFGEVVETSGGRIDRGSLYDVLYDKALEGEPDCGGIVSYNYYSGEHITGFEEGRPLITHLPGSSFTLANFMRNLLFSTVATLKLGMNILTEQEKVRLDSLLGHGGLFKTEGVAQRLVAAALETPISVMESAGEGGAWGIALLAAFMAMNVGESLEEFLIERVFAGKTGRQQNPDPVDVTGFREYIKRYSSCLPIERTAVEKMEAK